MAQGGCQNDLTEASTLSLRNLVRSVKGCTHRAMILCDGVVNSYQKEKSKAIAQWEHLSFTIFVFSLQKTAEITCDGFLTKI